MEKNLNKKLDDYIIKFKDDCREKAIELGITDNNDVKKLIQYIYDYERFSLNKEDFQKRKRVKNFVPLFDRCCAKRASDQQCTRKKKEGCDFCGTHTKGTPYGIINNDDNTNNEENKLTRVEVWTQDIKGIIYYIDDNNNVYDPEDILSNKTNPRIIAKWIKNEENYSIPEFGL